MAQFTACISCDCGAKYERGEAQLPIKDIGIFECHYCGVALERWHGRSVPYFRLMSAPQTKDRSVA